MPSRLALVLTCSLTATICLADDTAKSFQHKARPGPVASAELVTTVKALDARFFGALFDRCDVATMRAMVAEDFEFYHDKDGLSATSGKQFTDNIAAMCERQKAGEDYRARRELDPDSVEVFAMNKYGAIEIGLHRFYMLEPGKPEKLVEISRFTNLWKNDNGQWRLTRVLSYDHRTTE